MVQVSLNSIIAISITRVLTIIIVHTKGVSSRFLPTEMSILAEWSTLAELPESFPDTCLIPTESKFSVNRISWKS